MANFGEIGRERDVKLLSVLKACFRIVAFGAIPLEQNPWIYIKKNFFFNIFFFFFINSKKENYVCAFYLFLQINWSKKKFTNKNKISHKEIYKYFD